MKVTQHKISIVLSEEDIKIFKAMLWNASNCLPVDVTKGSMDALDIHNPDTVCNKCRAFAVQLLRELGEAA